MSDKLAPKRRLPWAWRYINMGDGDWQIRLGPLMLAYVSGRWSFQRVNARRS